ncbi:MAG TPA: serine/threonine-protein kinase [Polyangiaceae bacterium]|nr:serine/threonine-protein kinase [Polyangiaceae bacterium]
MSASDPLGMIGQVLHGQFRVDDLIEDGKRSFLYRGAHLMLEVPIAIKCMKAPPGGSHEQFIRRFRHESRLHYKLSQASPHVVRVLASGTAVAPAGSQLTPFMVLEWLEGETLARDIAARRAQGLKGRTLADVIRLLDPPVEALAFAHTQGIVHREVTPETLFVARLGDGARIKVLDFGVAKILGERALDLPPASQSMGLVPIGSPAYAAPEQYSSTIGAVGTWTDVYALAMVFLEMMMDRPVLDEGPMPMAIRVLDMKQRPTPRTLGIEVSDRVEAVLAQAVALRPEERHQEAGEFWGMLKNALMRDQDSLLRVSKLPVTGTSQRPEGSDSRTAALLLVHERHTEPEEMRQTLSPTGDEGQGAIESPPSSREPQTLVVREEELTYDDGAALTVERAVPQATLEMLGARAALLARPAHVPPPPPPAQQEAGIEAPPPESAEDRTVVMQADELRNLSLSADQREPVSRNPQPFAGAGRDPDATVSNPDTTTRAPLKAPMPKPPVIPNMGAQWPFQQPPAPGAAGGAGAAGIPGVASPAFPYQGGHPGSGQLPVQGQMPGAFGSGQPPFAPHGQLLPGQPGQIPGPAYVVGAGPSGPFAQPGMAPAQPAKPAAKSPLTSILWALLIVLGLIVVIGAAAWMAARLGWI